MIDAGRCAALPLDEPQSLDRSLFLPPPLLPSSLTNIALAEAVYATALHRSPTASATGELEVPPPPPSSIEFCSTSPPLHHVCFPLSSSSEHDRCSPDEAGSSIRNHWFSATSPPFQYHPLLAGSAPKHPLASSSFRNHWFHHKSATTTLHQIRL